MSFDDVKKIAEAVDGTIEEVGALPDGSGFATMSLALPKDHWLYKDEVNDPPAPLRMGVNNPLRKPLSDAIREVARYAVRSATMNGRVDDYDPDAMVQNFITGMLGYYTGDGLSHI